MPPPPVVFSASHTFVIAFTVFLMCIGDACHEDLFCIALTKHRMYIVDLHVSNTTQNRCSRMTPSDCVESTYNLDAKLSYNGGICNKRLIADIDYTSDDSYGYRIGDEVIEYVKTSGGRCGIERHERESAILSLVMLTIAVLSLVAYYLTDRPLA